MITLDESRAGDGEGLARASSGRPTIAADARRNGVGYVDTRPWFCAHPSGAATDWLCPLVVNHTITSIDRGHASKTYALELGQPFRGAFRRELFR